MATQFAVDLLFKANTSKLKDATAKFQDLEQKAKGAQQGATGAANGIRAFGRSAGAAVAPVRALGAAVQAVLGPLAALDLARRYFKGFGEAEKASAAVRTLGVDSKALERQLLAVSNRLGGLYSQTQLLAASYDVASAGFADAADNAKILEAAAKGAVGGMSDLNTVGNAATSVLNAYGLSADKAAKLVDGFIQTQNDGKIVVDQYAQYIGKLAPLGKAAGVGIEELNAAISTITAQGVPVEATFTGLTQAMVAILKPTKEASDLAKGLGIDFSAAGLEAKGFGGLMAEVKEKTGGSTEAMTKLFGSVEALKAVLPLTNDDLVTFNKNLEKQGKAAGVADGATKELGGTVSSEITKMVNQIGNLVRALDTVLGPAIGGIIKLINAVIAQATKGINVLAQLFSMSKNTSILKQALESGDLRGNAAARVVPGVDELIGGERRQELQRQAGAGTGFLGLGFDAQKFAELLKKEPAIQKLLGTGGANGKPEVEVTMDPKLQALLDSLLKDTGGGGSASKEGEKLAQQLQESLKAGQDLSRQFTRQVQLLEETDDLEKRLLQLKFSKEDRQAQINNLLNAEQQAQLTLLNNDLSRLQVMTEMEAAATRFAESMKLDASYGQGNVAELGQMTQAAEMAAMAGQTIGDAFGNSFKSIADGTKTAQEAIADFFKSIGDALLNYAATAIAQYIAIGIARMFAGVSGGGVGGTDWGSMGTSQFSGGFGIDSAGLNAGFAPFAEGGYVTGPTNALIGEAGESEYVIPSSKMGAAMANYRAGRRGDSVVSDSAMGSDAEDGGNNTFTLETVVINKVEYATVAQVREMGAVAAKQGAQGGYAKTMGSMRNSRSTRARLGMG